MFKIGKKLNLDAIEIKISYVKDVSFINCFNRCIFNINLKVKQPQTGSPNLLGYAKLENPINNCN